MQRASPSGSSRRASLCRRQTPRTDRWQNGFDVIGRQVPQKVALEPPLRNLPASLLLEKLIADYVFALLTEAAVESLASENAARFSTMEAAHDNVSKKLDQLRQDA